MEKLAADTAQACQLLVLDNDSVITIHQALPLSVITVIAKIGEKIPINLSAGGTILTLLLPNAKLTLFLKKAWKTVREQTEYSILDIEEYKKKLAVSNEQGLCSRSGRIRAWNWLLSCRAVRSGKQSNCRAWINGPYFKL